MAKDVEICDSDGLFKLRVCGVIKQGDKYLVNNANGCGFHGFPGGHVSLGENTDDAVLREVEEETKIECKAIKLLAIVQLLIKREDGKPFHEIGYYYLLEPKNNKNYTNFSIDENDDGKIKHHEFIWLTLDEFDNYDIRPEEMKDILKNNLERQHLIKYS